MITLFRNKSQSKTTLSDIEFVNGIANSEPYVEQAFYNHCKAYFFQNVDSVFFITDKQVKKDVFQDSFIKLWEFIELKKIYVNEGVIIGPNNKPLQGTLTTYLMGIAKNKFLEWVRSSQREFKLQCIDQIDLSIIDTIAIEIQNGSDYDDIMAEIVSECISKMPKHCFQILTMFYYENKSLDEILCCMSMYHSKDALKTSKNKCLKTLKKNCKKYL